MDNFDERDLARIIGEFYLDKNKGDYKKAHEEISSLGITEIYLSKTFIKTISIKLLRPGLIIGRRGENIDKLKEYLSKQLGFSCQLKIIEDKVIPFLYPCEPYNYNIFDEYL